MLRTGRKLVMHSDKRWSSGSGPNLRIEILEASLKNVTNLGWTQDSIAKGVMDLGLPPLTHSVIERGPVELVEYFINKKREYAKERVAKLRGEHSASQRSNIEGQEESKEKEQQQHAQEVRELTVDEILQEAIEAHIDFISPYIHSWPSALALFADPMQVSVAMNTGLQLADDIVTLGGIEASRGDWYTERLLAIMLYTSTELFMLTDTSPNFSETR